MEIAHLTSENARLLPRPGEVGIAREWIVWPAPREPESPFNLRISTVELAAPGPLTRVEGYDRLFAVTEGEGLLLSHGDAAPRASVRRLEVYAFPGDWPTEAELHRGVVTVLNVTTRRGGAKARVEALRLGTRRVLEASEAPAVFLYAVRGSLVARITDEDDPVTLAAGESLWLSALEGSEEIELQGDEESCEALIVRVGPE